MMPGTLLMMIVVSSHSVDRPTVIKCFPRVLTLIDKDLAGCLVLTDSLLSLPSLPRQVLSYNMISVVIN